MLPMNWRKSRQNQCRSRVQREQTGQHIDRGQLRMGKMRRKMLQSPKMSLALSRKSLPLLSRLSRATQITRRMLRQSPHQGRSSRDFPLFQRRTDHKSFVLKGLIDFHLQHLHLIIKIFFSEFETTLTFAFTSIDQNISAELLILSMVMFWFEVILICVKCCWARSSQDAASTMTLSQINIRLLWMCFQSTYVRQFSIAWAEMIFVVQDTSVPAARFFELVAACIWMATSYTYSLHILSLWTDLIYLFVSCNNFITLEGFALNSLWKWI